MSNYSAKKLSEDQAAVLTDLQHSTVDCKSQNP